MNEMSSFISALLTHITDHLSGGDPLAAALIVGRGRPQEIAWASFVILVSILASCTMAIVLKKADRYKALFLIAVALGVVSLSCYSILYLEPDRTAGIAASLRSAVSAPDREVEFAGDVVRIRAAFVADTLHAFGATEIRRNPTVVVNVPYSALPGVERALALEGLALVATESVP